MATKKTGSTTPRTRAKKASVQNPEVAPDNGAATAAAPAKVSATPTPNFDHPAEIQERIRQRAYELFEQRGGMHGFDIEDWLKAEAEISESK